MSNSKAHSFPSVLALVAILLTSAVLVPLSPWLHEDLFPSLGLGLPWDFAAVLALGYISSTSLIMILMRLTRKTRFDTSWLGASSHIPRKKVIAEVRDVAPYLNLMSHQLDGAVKETEQGVMALIESINAVYAVSDKQLERIRNSEQGGAELSAALHEKVLVDKQLGLILQMFVDKQEQDVAANLERIKRLQEVKSLGPLVDVISSVARQTNFLSINAAVEAAHAGDSGRGFAVLATEIRQLSNRTASAAVDIAAKIKAATEGIDQELHAATQVDARQSATGNMRKVMGDIDEMQRRFSDASNQLLNIINGVGLGHQAIVTQLSQALGQIQFQDVIRQRVEQVQSALGELDEHLQTMTDQMQDKPWDPQTLGTLRERLDAQMAAYVMQSQRETHQQVTGQSVGDAARAVNDRPKIELF
jgi:methyl-accepting chemotaxis protein